MNQGAATLWRTELVISKLPLRPKTTDHSGCLKQTCPLRRSACLDADGVSMRKTDC